MAVDALLRKGELVLGPMEHTEYDRAMMEVRSNTASSVWEAAWEAEGEGSSAKSMEQAIKYALEEGRG